MKQLEIELKPYAVNAVMKDKSGKTIRSYTAYYATELERSVAMRETLDTNRTTIEEGGEIRFILGTMTDVKAYRLQFTEIPVNINTSNIEIVETTSEVEI